jgi:lipid A disaccharide synthetase
VLATGKERSQLREKLAAAETESWLWLVEGSRRGDITAGHYHRGVQASHKIGR